jgi:hypothetical protein
MKLKLFNFAKQASCIAWASFKPGAPKLSAALNFLWLLSLFQDKESDMDLWRAKNEQIIFQDKESNKALDE